MKIGLKLFETGYRFDSIERVRVYLTNALEPPSDDAQQLAFAGWAPALAHEAQAVNAIKRWQRFTVVIGNPPYSVSSLNQSEWITGLIEAYKEDVRAETNIGPLSDDYIKFIRLAEHFVKTGIIAIITNNGYLSGLVHRGMRRHLLNSYTKVRILDLGGNSQLGDIAVDGGPDQNVFDIQQGVAISVYSRFEATSDLPQLQYCRLSGLREVKYQTLLSSSISSMKSVQLPLAEHAYVFFVPKDFSLQAEIETYASMTEIFPHHGTCLETRHDPLLVAFTLEELQTRIEMFADPGVPASLITRELGLTSTRTWDMSAARKIIADNTVRPMFRCLYRPFDIRWVYYEPRIIERGSHAWPTMRHILEMENNLALVCSRQIARNTGFDTGVVTRYVAEKKLGDSTRSSTMFPLRLSTRSALFEKSEDGLNIGSRILTQFRELVPKEGIVEHPEIVFQYVYALLYSPTYRTRYAEFLKIDFPRLPLTCSLDLFRALAALGGELVALHLMESPALAQHITTYAGPAAPEVEKVSYADGTVWINKAQTRGFRGVPEEVWSFHIGGYQVCDKWLKDRKGRVLSAEDIEHYQRVVVALHETIRIMGEIDEVIEEHGGWPMS